MQTQAVHVNRYLQQESSHARSRSRKAVTVRSRSARRRGRRPASCPRARRRSRRGGRHAASRGCGTAAAAGRARRVHGLLDGGVLVALGVLGLGAGALVDADGLQLVALGLDGGGGRRAGLVEDGVERRGHGRDVVLGNAERGGREADLHDEVVHFGFAEIHEFVNLGFFRDWSALLEKKEKKKKRMKVSNG